jgi:uncharacterized protein (DUF433 family)/DNA-binding transcriptional MerR regulator
VGADRRQGRLSEAEPWHFGLYSVAEAARYSTIPMSTVHRWIRRGPGVEHEPLVSFDEFITLLFVRRLRDLRVPLREISRAEEDLRARTQYRHPFAHETLWVAGRDVMVRVPESADIFLSANRRGQMALPGIVETRRVELSNLVADVRGELVYVNGRVGMWRPMERIAARPAVQFGLTCIEGTRLTTQALSEAASAGDQPRELARLFEVTESDVDRAIAWEHRLAA